MRSALLAVITLCLFVAFADAQIALHPSIGVSRVPTDNDSICPITQYLGSFNNDGLFVNDTSYDFTLYDREGNSMTLSKMLADGKPVVLMSCSYTCPYFRNSIPIINELFNRYGDKVHFYLIYVYEAHPIVDLPPYGDNPEANSFNLDQGIQYRQPATYRVRKDVANDLVKNYEINVPILFDGPCNQWMTHFGPAPNNAYLINPQGIIVSKHPWLNTPPYDMAADIESALSQINPNPVRSFNGSITIVPEGPKTITTGPGQKVKISCEVINRSSQDAEIRMRRTTGGLPISWSTSLCSDLCQNPSVDSTTFFMKAHDSANASIYIYTDSIPSEGSLEIRLANPNVGGDAFAQTYRIITTGDLGVAKPNLGNGMSAIVSPSPTASEFTIQTSLPYSSIRICNSLGNAHSDLQRSATYSISLLPRGVYFVQLLTERGERLSTIKLVKFE